MGSGNRKTCDPYRLLLNLSDKKEVINPDKGGLFESSFFLRVGGRGAASRVHLTPFIFQEELL